MENSKNGSAPAVGPIRVLVADDAPTALNAMCAYLELEGGFEIVGTASDGLNLLQQAEIQKPDLVLVDLQMPRMNGLEVAQRLRAQHPQVAVIVFSEFEAAVLKAECMQRGADAFVQKSQMPEQLMREIARLFPRSHRP
ncbi:MAG TPA: response regulator transcription factor [Candidatus Binatia bacterium]|nr:response regulator transcription factor [Candidatus Binatia bacterium]